MWKVGVQTRKVSFQMCVSAAPPRGATAKIDGRFDSSKAENRREHPVQAGGTGVLRGGEAAVVQQAGVERGSKPELLRKERCAAHVVGTCGEPTAAVGQGGL